MDLKKARMRSGVNRSVMGGEGLFGELTLLLNNNKLGWPEALPNKTLLKSNS